MVCPRCGKGAPYIGAQCTDCPPPVRAKPPPPPRINVSPWVPTNFWHQSAMFNLAKAFGWDWSAFDVKINRFNP
jgi:hypothetical protein